MRAIAWETVFQTALRNCSKEVRGKVSIYVILVKGKYMQSSTYFCRLFLLVLWRLLLVMRGRHYHAFLDMRPYKNWAHKINSWNYPTIWGPVWSLFFPTHGVPLPRSPPWTLFRGCWKSAAIAAPEHHFRGRWQVPMASANLYSNIVTVFKGGPQGCIRITWSISYNSHS